MSSVLHCFSSCDEPQGGLCNPPCLLGYLILISGIGTPDNTFLNINIPNLPTRRVKGFMVTRLGKRIYNDAVVERLDPRGGKYYWIGGNGENYEHIRGTDFYAVEKGYVSITPLDLDMTGMRSMRKYKVHFGNSV